VDETAASSSSPARNPGIDFLRGLSIFLVVIHHVGLRIPLKQGVLSTFLPKWFLGALVFNGYQAVFIFFVISGFLIASNTLARWGSLPRVDIKAFYRRRAGRILPCLLLLVGALSLLHLAGAKDYVIAGRGQSLPRAIFSALGLHLNWYEGRTGYLPGGWDVLWSLSIEEVFYLGFPLLCLGLKRDRFLIPILLLLTLSLPVSLNLLEGNDIWQEKAYLPGMAAIATGVFSAIAAARFTRNGKTALPWLFGAGTAGTVAALFGRRLLWPVLGNGVMLLLTLSTACLLVALHWQAREGKAWVFPGMGWLRSMGRLSYEIYLTHMFVVFLVIRFFRSTHSGLWWGILWYIPAIPLTWGFGWLVARYISNPSEAWMRGCLSSPGTPSPTPRERIPDTP
jgi:peptidoglycan/LPS O-acetylase OafA/YrhL